MADDAAAAQREGRARLVDWSGNLNPHPRGKGGIRYNADRHFPAYFDADQLYDLDADPIEQKNLARYLEEKSLEDTSPENTAVMERLQHQLSELLESLPHTFGEFKK